MDEFPRTPIRKPRKLVQGDVDANIVDLVDSTAKRMGMKRRQVVEWGFQAFLLRFNPRMAKFWGIVPEKRGKK